MLCKNKNCNKGNFGKRAKFEPSADRKTQVCCSTECVIEVINSKTYKNKREKEIRIKNEKQKKELLDSWKSHGKWIADLQKVFNRFIRLRDEGIPCISCGATVAEDWHAGHYVPTTKQYLRFNEFNVNVQCSKCNTHLRGNIIPYRINLIKKIGLEAVEKLENDMHLTLDITIPEIKEWIEIYKLKCKNFR
jgi:hypothetical protein